MAAWDLYARDAGPAAVAGPGRHARPHRLRRLDRHPGLARPAGRRRSSNERAAGYQRIKIKIKPGWDIDAVERVRARFGEIPLMVDANAAYTLDDAAHLARLDAYDLMMIEQPLDYDDVMDHVALQQAMRRRSASTSRFTPCRIARDAIAPAPAASSTSSRAASAAIAAVDRAARPVRRARHPGLARRHARERHRPRPQHPPGEPAELPPARRHRAPASATTLPDLIEPAIDIAADGTIAVPTGPGIGVDIVRERVEKATERHLVIDAREAVMMQHVSTAGRAGRCAADRASAAPKAAARGRHRAPGPDVCEQKMRVDPAARGSARWLRGRPPPADLVTLLADESGAHPTARRAGGRDASRIAGGHARSRRLLATEPDPEVRQMAAFAMGLIGDAAARAALTTALADPDPLIQGRAAEALGHDRRTRPRRRPIGAMVGRARRGRRARRASTPTTWATRRRRPWKPCAWACTRSCGSASYDALAAALVAIGWPAAQPLVAGGLCASSASATRAPRRCCSTLFKGEGS